MQVVQPKPTRLKPTLSRSSCRPELERYSATTWLPGASEVFTHGLAFRPLAAALRANRPAADQHARIGRIGAGGDGRDHDVAMTEIEIVALNRIALRDVRRLLVFAGHRGGEAGGHGWQGDAPLGTLRTGHRGHDVGKIERQRFREYGIDRLGGAEQALRLGIGRNQLDAFGLAAGGLEIIDGRGVDREEAAGRAIFRRHVADGRLVRDREMVEAGAEEFNELTDHALLAQHLRHGQHQIGRSHAFLQLSP